MSGRTEAYWLRLLPRFVRTHITAQDAIRGVVANSSWLLFEKMVRLVLGLLVGAWVARYLGPVKFGELTYVVAFVAFFQVVANLGLDAIVIRDIARRPDEAPQVLGSAFVARLLAGVACWAVAVGAMACSGDRDKLTLVALIGGVLVFQAAETVDLWFQSQSQNRRTVICRMAAYCISNGLKVALVLTSASLPAFAAVLAVEAAFVAVGLWLAYRAFPASAPWQAVGSVSRQLFKDSFPFLLSGISVIVYMRIDQIMIKQMLGDREVGIYAAATTISSVWQMVPMVLFSAVMPHMVRLREHGPDSDAYLNTLYGVFRMFSALMLVMAVSTAAASGFIIQTLYGETYSDSATILALHVFSNIFIALGVAQGLWIINENKGLIRLYQTLIGAVVCIVGNFLLIPLLGVLGAAVVAVLSQMSAAVLSNILFDRKIFMMQCRSILLLPRKIR